MRQGVPRCAFYLFAYVPVIWYNDYLMDIVMKGGAAVKIMLSAGEVSGDIQGARIAEAILAQAPQAELFGLGGRKMEQAGVRLVRNFADYNVMGVWEVVKNLRRILRLLSELEDSIREEKPDLLVLIDYPDFNWRLAKKAKALGVPVFSYIPPSAWAWRKGRAKDCAAIADEFCAIFPHELPPYEAAGAKISFVGNPMVDAVRPEIPEQEAREYFALAEDEQAVLLLPGSRRQEIELLLPDMLGAVHILAEGRPGLRFFLPVADQALEGRITSLIEAAGLTGRIELTHEHRYALMGLGTAAMATSGTVVMEAALLGLPCVVLYRMGRLNYFLGRLLVHIESFSLPNIILGEPFETELLQAAVEPGRIAEEVRCLLPGSPRREQVLAKLRAACDLLGPPGASGRVAEKILAAARDKE